jgi:hypothetical protein
LLVAHIPLTPSVANSHTAGPFGKSCVAGRGVVS